jgi:hypothetical protein
MRFLLILALFCAPAFARADGVEFIRVWPGWKGTDSFKTISEYFTGKEVTGKLTVGRTKPDSRDGYYWLVRVANKNAPMDGAQFVLKVITPDSPFAKEFKFPVGVPKGQTVYDLGLTGTDWPGRHAHPVAWRLDLLASDGTALVTQKSFLWDKPST